MPFVSIRILAGHSRERKDRMAARVTEAIGEETGLPAEAIWVVFEEVAAEDWHVGGRSVAERRRTGGG
ncbi:MAG TPA: 2-hydroxymuconate tautomerase [Acetobacteraceae bacterium]|nr:2-hydroxymuconate tautomerase [Acetobacteraceae bacterium]